jgi:Ca2+-binding EF-hand superfamily protein
MWKTLAILGLALSIASGSALAQEKHDKHSPKHQRPDAEQIIKAKDKDHDGRLSKEEFVGKATEPERVKHLEARFKAIDANADGYVTLDELKAAHEKHAQGPNRQDGKKPPHKEKTIV